jgi:hypothetical protein
MTQKKMTIVESVQNAATRTMDQLDNEQRGALERVNELSFMELQASVQIEQVRATYVLATVMANIADQQFQILCRERNRS